jgi:hypothetical protein
VPVHLLTDESIADFAESYIMVKQFYANKKKLQAHGTGYRE